MSVKSLIICIFLFYVLFYFLKYLFYGIRTTVSGDYISNPVYYRSNSSLEKNRSLQIISKQLDIKLGPFTQELGSALRKIKNRKAAGLDELPPEVWKTCGIWSLKVTGKGQGCIAVRISDSIFWLYHILPQSWPVGVMLCTRKSQKNYTKEKTATDKRRSRFFYTFLYLLGSTTIPWMRKFFLNT